MKDRWTAVQISAHLSDLSQDGKMPPFELIDSKCIDSIHARVESIGIWASILELKPIRYPKGYWTRENVGKFYRLCARGDKEPARSSFPSVVRAAIARLGINHAALVQELGLRRNSIDKDKTPWKNWVIAYLRKHHPEVRNCHFSKEEEPWDITVDGVRVIICSARASAGGSFVCSPYSREGSKQQADVIVLLGIDRDCKEVIASYVFPAAYIRKSVSTGTSARWLFWKDRWRVITSKEY